MQIEATPVKINVHQASELSADDEVTDYYEGKNQLNFPFKIINIVALGILQKDGEKLAVDFAEVEKYIEVKKLKRFPCIQFKIDGISMILFKNGKIILTGIKKRSLLDSLKVKIIERLHEGHVEFDTFEIKIQNLVIMTKLEKLINLEYSCITLNNCLYEPEQFPAAIVKPETGGTFLIFSNSKIIGLGMKSMEEVNKSLKFIIQEIYNYDLFIEENSDFLDEDFEEFLL